MSEGMPLWAWLICFVAFGFTAGILWVAYKISYFLDKNKDDK